ncbi:nuclear transport factor 2 family protein [Phytomonospora sp. NPDC050363]|uniref:nuclear transport factor 2 family protein n=1 Tax=Phytomonospora sp. NPDC050363 TaxID=3155642 RepID=UPI0033F7E5C2
MTKISDTRAVIDQFLANTATGDAEGIAALFADEVDWKLNWPERPFAETPWIRSRSKASEVAAHFISIAEHHIPEKAGFSGLRVLVDGADAVVLGVIEQTARPTGRAYTARVALHFTVEEGRIVRYHVYEDSLAVAEAFGAR